MSLAGVERHALPAEAVRTAECLSGSVRFPPGRHAGISSSVGTSCSMRTGVRLVLTTSALVMALTSCSRTESSSSSASANASSSAATSGGSSPVSKSAPKRGHVACAAFLSETVKSSNELKVPMWAEPGSWSGLHSDLQRLPPGGELCGATHFGEPKDKPSTTTVFVRSSLYGDDLKRFWDPVMTAAGCTFRKGEEAENNRSQFTWLCPHDKNGVVTVITNPGEEIYAIGYVILGR